MNNLINRELSWLSFNERVLQEGLDKNNPLVERLRFLGIYSNNMDEFFRVRVANINRMIAVDNNKLDGYKGSAKDLLNEIQRTIKKQRKIYVLAYQQIIKSLEDYNIYHVNEKNINNDIKVALSNYYHNYLKQDIVPIILDPNKKFPRLQDKGIYLAVKLVNSNKNKKRYSLIQIPANHERFLTFIKGNKKYIIILDDIIRLYLSKIFSIFDFDEIEAFTFKFTRDAELNIDDDISISMYDKMEESIKQRKKGEPLRFIYDESMDENLLKYLKTAIGISGIDHIVPGGRYHNFKDLMNFPDFAQQNLVFNTLPPLEHPAFVNQKSLIKVILSKDVLLHYPYHKFDYLVDLLREAAIDPKVIEIKISVYRIAKKSQILNALINAIKNGKEVTVVVELQARFDEKNNMHWSNIMREHGARIIYGIPGLKVHAKLIQITRQSGKKEQLIAHIGTGNFHGETARIYTDFSLLTSSPLITKEVKKVFNVMENNIERGIYRHLLVSPFNTRRKFIDLVNTEIKNSKKGNEAIILIKVNNLVDAELINKLYEASQAGVKVRVICRGICCLVPNKKGVSENIEVKSIVGRFLEHKRLFIFSNNGVEKYFISSADWMTRNLEKRIEVTVPILDNKLQEQIKTIFEIQWLDNVKARIIDIKQKNRYVQQLKSQPKINAQHEIYRYYQEKL